MSTPLPVDIPTVRVTGQYRAPNGRALSGSVTFSGPSLLTFAESNLFIASPVVSKLDLVGRISDDAGNPWVDLPATDSPNMNPADWSYVVKENLTGVSGVRTYALLLPAGTGPIDLADVAPADPSTPTYVPVPGPPGLVTSVNGISIPHIVLSASDVGALSRYTGSPRVDVSQGSVDLFYEKTLTHVTVAQSTAVDYVNGVVYVAQLMGDAYQLPDEPAPLSAAERDERGDICINQLSLTGTLLGAMHVRGAGHGTSVGVEYGRDGLVWLWIDRDASSSGFARSLSRIQFAAGTIVESDSTTSYAPYTGMHGVSCFIDSYNRRIAVRYTYPDPSDTGRRFEIYDLDDAVAQRWVPLGSFLQDANASPPTLPGPAVGVFQGHTIFGNFVYTADGSPNTDNAYITVINWTTGKQVQRVKVTSHYGLTYREPEGMAIHIPKLGSPHRFQLLYGFASGSSGARKYTLAAIDADSPPPRIGVNLNAGETPQANVDVVATSGIPGVSVRGSGGAHISQWTNSGAGTPATWVSSGGHLATIKNGYFAGDAIQVNSLATDVGGGKGVVGITNATTVPTAHPSAGVILYATGGAARVRGNGLAVVDSSGLETELTASPLPSPADHGFLAWSIDPATSNAGTAPASGVMQLVRVRLRSPRTVSSVVLFVNTAGAGLTAGQSLVGLYNMSGTRLAISADQSAAWATNDEKTVSFTSPVTNLAAGNYWVAILSNGTTPPAFTRASAQGGNMGIPLAETRFGLYSTGLTTLPGTITPASVTRSGVAYAVGLK
ncbi:hypothetical protein [Streptomyces sp. NPDC059874]|uniref:phage baseplate protein n=1 Tax=Streptomyces sp. NPDC059874 TaxID=3346983 RepID=UPI00364B4883